MNILDLISGDGFTFKKVAATHGGEYAGPCPWCGGNDRFLIWPEHAGGSRYWCRGCDKKGDAIQYLRDTRGFSFDEACQFLGISKDGYKIKRSKPKTEKPVFKPKKYDDPPAIWMKKAGIILKDAQEKLWSSAGQAAREILKGKGLSEETIRRAGIGFNPVALYRDRRGWDLPQEFRYDGKQKLLWIPAGLVIPLTLSPKQDGRNENQKEVVRLRVRRHDPGDGPRYVIVSGSLMAPLVLKSEKNIFIIVESELDAWLAWQEAADLSGIIAMGAANMKPDISTHEILLNAEKIINALDYDPAGARWAWKFWPETYGSKVKRWPVPIGKDPSDAWQRGLNIRTWIEAGIE
jgi:hypothetical protein